MKLRWFLVFSALCILPSVRTYSRGAPKSVCASMTPSHGVPAQPDPAPYQLTLSAQSVSSGDIVTLVLNKTESDAAATPDFKGFMIEAINADDGAIVGSFQGGANNKVIACNADSNAITHSDSSGKSSAVLAWTAPSVTSKMTVKFLFTVVQSKPVFWAKQEAKGTVVVEPAAANGDTTLSTAKATDASATTPTTTETVTASPVSQGETDSIYSGCGKSRGCFGSGKDCVSSGNCEMMASYRYLSEDKSFEMTLTGSGIDNGMYLAVGLSSDQSMGEDLVFFCGNGVDGVKVSWNTGHSGSKLATGVQVKNPSVKHINGRTICTFSVDEKLSVATPVAKNLDLDNEEFHVLLAKGPLDGENLEFHSEKVASDSAVSLKVSALLGGASEGWLIQVHGCLMIFAWLASAATGMLMARYYKQTWTSVRPMGKDLWFRVHQLCMGLAVILTLVAFAVILAALKGEPFDPEALKRNPHAVIGIVCIICAFLQPIMAYFRPHPETKFRWVFNWAHWLVGNAAFTFAIAAIFLSVELPGPKLPKTLTDAMIAYVVVHAVIHLVLMAQRFHASHQDDDGGPKGDEHSVGGLIRKVAGFTYFSFVWVFAIAFVVHIILAKKNSL